MSTYQVEIRFFKLNQEITTYVLKREEDGLYYQLKEHPAEFDRFVINSPTTERQLWDIALDRLLDNEFPHLEAGSKLIAITAIAGLVFVNKQKDIPVYEYGDGTIGIIQRRSNP